MTDRPPKIRNNIESYGDPYIGDESLRENTVCVNCGAVYMQSRWYTTDIVPEKPSRTVGNHKTLCPACRKMRDRVPGGVLKMSGNFIWSHREEIINLIRNEANEALRDNPLERVMSMETYEDEVLISTTNEKLAQRIGRALHSAYAGDLQYKWSEDNKLARVNWHREERGT